MELLCPDHIPANFIQDPVSLIWVPSFYVSPIYVVLQKLQLLRAARDDSLHLTALLTAELSDLRNAEQKLRDDIQKIRGKLDHRYKITGNGACRIPAGLACSGLSGHVVPPKMGAEKTGNFRGGAGNNRDESRTHFLFVFIEFPRFLVIPRDSPPKKRPAAAAKPKAKAIPAGAASDSEEFVEESESESLELEGSESDSRSSSSRLITRSALRKMQVDKDDMLITTKHGARSGRQVYINVTRLQEFIRAEGQSVENDPFIRYLGRLPAELFVSGAGIERAKDAAMRVQGNRGNGDENGGNEGSVGSKGGQKGRNGGTKGGNGEVGSHGGSVETENHGGNMEIENQGGNQNVNGENGEANSGNSPETPEILDHQSNLNPNPNPNPNPIHSNHSNNPENEIEIENENEIEIINSHQSGNEETQNSIIHAEHNTPPNSPANSGEPRDIPVLLNSIKQTDSSTQLTHWKFRGFEPAKVRVISFHSLHSLQSPLPPPSHTQEDFPAGDSPSITHALAKFEGILSRRSDCGRSFHVIERFFAKLFANGRVSTFL